MKCPKCNSKVRAVPKENTPIKIGIRERQHNDSVERHVDFSDALICGKGEFTLECTNPVGICSYEYGFADIDRHGNITMWPEKKISHSGDKL